MNGYKLSIKYFLTLLLMLLIMINVMQISYAVEADPTEEEEEAQAKNVLTDIGADSAERTAKIEKAYKAVLDNINTLGIGPTERLDIFVSETKKGKKMHLYLQGFQDTKRRDYNLVETNDGTFEKRDIGLFPTNGLWENHLVLGSLKGKKNLRNDNLRSKRTVVKTFYDIFLEGKAQFIVHSSELTLTQRDLVKKTIAVGEKYGGWGWFDLAEKELIAKMFNKKLGSSKVIVTQNLKKKRSNVHVMHYNADDSDYYSSKFHSSQKNAKIPKYHEGLFSKAGEKAKYDKGKKANVSDLGLIDQVETKLKNLATSSVDIEDAKEFRTKIVNTLKDKKDKKKLNSVLLLTDDDLDDKANTLVGNLTSNNLGQTKKTIKEISDAVGAGRKSEFEKSIFEDVSDKLNNILDNPTSDSKEKIDHLFDIVVDHSYMQPLSKLMAEKIPAQAKTISKKTELTDADIKKLEYLSNIDRGINFQADVLTNLDTSTGEAIGNKFDNKTIANIKQYQKAVESLGLGDNWSKTTLGKLNELATKDIYNSTRINEFVQIAGQIGDKNSFLGTLFKDVKDKKIPELNTSIDITKAKRQAQILYQLFGDRKNELDKLLNSTLHPQQKQTTKDRRAESQLQSRSKVITIEKKWYNPRNWFKKEPTIQRSIAIKSKERSTKIKQKQSSSIKKPKTKRKWYDPKTWIAEKSTTQKLADSRKTSTTKSEVNSKRSKQKKSQIKDEEVLEQPA